MLIPIKIYYYMTSHGDGSYGLQFALTAEDAQWGSNHDEEPCESSGSLETFEGSDCHREATLFSLKHSLEGQPEAEVIQAFTAAGYYPVVILRDDMYQPVDWSKIFAEHPVALVVNLAFRNECYTCFLD